MFAPSSLSISPLDVPTYNLLAVVFEILSAVTVLPVVAFESRINREIMSDAGLYAEFNSAPSLAEMLLKVIEDDDLRKSLGIKAREQSLRVFSWEKNAKKIEKLYETIINHK